MNLIVLKFLKLTAWYININVIFCKYLKLVIDISKFYFFPNFTLSLKCIFNYKTDEMEITGDTWNF